MRYQSTPEKEFDGDIIITDPCYIIRKENGITKNDWHYCEYGASIQKSITPMLASATKSAMRSVRRSSFKLTTVKSLSICLRRATTDMMGNCTQITPHFRAA